MSFEPKLIGPFRQLVSLNGLPMRGPILKDKIQIVERAGVLVQNGVITAVGEFEQLRKNAKQIEHPPSTNLVLLPAFVDCHTHICFGGSRAKDYDLRIAGTSYQEILRSGGGAEDAQSDQASFRCP